MESLRCLVKARLERQVHSELYLPRGAGLAGRESRARNPPEHRAADDVAGLAQVRVVKKVEELGPQLEPQVVAEPHEFDERKICVVERGADDDVSAQTPETR